MMSSHPDLTALVARERALDMQVSAARRQRSQRRQERRISPQRRWAGRRLLRWGELLLKTPGGPASTPSPAGTGAG